MLDLIEYIKSEIIDGFIHIESQTKIMNLFNLTFHQMELICLENNILPARYKKNLNSLSVKDQLNLFKSRVAVIGCGGLGGYVIEELSRLGVGYIRIIDPDCFEETNLNRQTMSSVKELNNSKVLVTKNIISDINPAVIIESYQQAFNYNSAQELFENIIIAVDCLDNIDSKIQLAQYCSEQNIILIHGAIAGWYGQIAVQTPGKNIIRKIYQKSNQIDGIEKHVGNLSFGPAIIAGIQVAETCKTLLN
ncbi:MAG: HesA/MoeB/ThiF family protein, partial [Cyanobacteriota bacterium]